jgi:hypothetical protein
VFVSRQYSWILGGISNGITGANGHSDGSGIDFGTEGNGNEWRQIEQWLPHAAWFLQALTAMNAAQPPSTAFTKP